MIEGVLKIQVQHLKFQNLAFTSSNIKNWFPL